MPQASSSKHQIRRPFYRDGHLVSLGLRTLEGIQRQLADPYQALWVVPGFRQARILLDTDGSMRQLKHMVEHFAWEPMRPQAIEDAGQMLAADAEYIHKLLSTLWKGNLAGIAYATTHLFNGATMAMALFHPVFITTDSLYYQEVEAAVGLDTTWTQYHRLLSGTSTSAEEDSSVEARGKLAMRLYRQTAFVLWPTLNEQRRSLVEQVLRLIEQAS